LKPKKFLFLPKYPRRGASSRLRTFQYLPLWEKEGYQVRVSSFFTDKYLRKIYKHQFPGYFLLLKCYINRFFTLFSARKYDLIVVEKELFPYLPAIAEWFLSKTKGYWIDFDDAVFHNYDQKENRWLGRLMPKKIDHVMKMANKVIVGNDYLKVRAELAGASSVENLPTVIDPCKYQMKKQKMNRRVCIGWIGSPSTFKYLGPMVGVLNWLHENYEIRFVLVNGTGKFNFRGQTEAIPWTEEGEVAAIHKMDIGIMPLPDNPWERGKCAYKLIQYMACGLPVVASPIGMNKEVVVDGVNGFLADSNAEWILSLQKLIEDPQLREKLGAAGRQKILENYTLGRNFSRYRKWVENKLDH
jgi:glycosyltransferase involved in cell wall biosynthesis